MNFPFLLGLIVTASFLLSIPPAEVLALTPAQVYDKVKDSVVVVKSLDSRGKEMSQGSGVILPSGKIATNCHVVEGGVSYLVGRGKKFVPSAYYGGDADKDVCLLEARGLSGKPAQPGRTGDLKVGVPVYAVGAPQGLELSISDGIVSQLRGVQTPLIQTTAAISPGSSGGGLFDGEGRLVGLTTLYIEGGQNLNFAIPVEWIGEVKPGRRAVSREEGRVQFAMRAAALKGARDWQGLLDLCRRWTKSYSGDVYAWFNLGFSYGELNRSQDAIEAYRQAVRINPEHAEVWYNQGIAYEKLNRSQDAIDAYRQALRIDPKHVSAWEGLGAAYRGLNRYTDAIDAYRQALRIDPKDASAWEGLGIAYHGLNRYTDAIDAFRQAVRVDPDYADAWYSLGVSYGVLNRHQDAIEVYRQAVRIDPKHTQSWHNLGVSYSKLHRIHDAIEAFRQAVRIAPKNSRGWQALGVAYLLSGNRTAALEVVKELRRLDPEAADKLFNMIVPR